jgi:glutamate carboxypeptidase
LRLLLTCDEEVGAPHSRTLIEKEGRRARGALVLEPPLPGGTMKTSRKGMAVYRIGVKGHSAHSGIEPEKGASATHAIVRILAKILELEDPQTGVTINVGVIGGGTAGNVVADAAEANVELRFWRREDGERDDENIRRIAAEGARDPRCSIEVIGGVSRWAMEPNSAGRVLEAAAVTAAQELGRELGSGRTGGSSDGQFLSAVGCPVLDGLGIDGGGAHTLEEHILLSDLPFRIALYARLFSRL